MLFNLLTLPCFTHFSGAIDVAADFLILGAIKLANVNYG